MKIDLPGKIKVGPYEYKVTARDYLWRKQTRSYGQSHHDTRLIEIVTEDLSPMMVLDTLLHEVLHAIWDISYLKDGDEEEHIVCVTATALCAVYLDNPELVKFQNKVLKESRRGS